MKKKKTISIVLPVFNEQDNIADCIETIWKHVEKLDYSFELILINDGSTDRTWDAIASCSGKYPIKAFAFSRNFGKEAAILAGLSVSRGDAVITMDADLQHPPEKLPEFIEKWERGAKIVEGRKIERGENESFFHKGCACMFYKLLGHAIQVDMRHMSDFKLLDREVVDIIIKLPEKQMFYRAISAWVGYPTDYVDYNVAERKKGSTKWNYKSLVKYAIRNITSFTSSPLQLVTFLGIAFFLIAIIVGSITLIKWASQNAVEGFTTVILIQLISGAFIMLAIGIVGYYIGKIADEIRDRPRYIIEKEIGEINTDEQR